MKLSEIHKQVGGFPFKAKINDTDCSVVNVEAVLSNGHYACTYHSRSGISSVTHSDEYRDWELVSPKPAPRKLYAYMDYANNEVIFHTSDRQLMEGRWNRAPQWDIEYE